MFDVNDEALVEVIFLRAELRVLNAVKTRCDMISPSVTRGVVLRHGVFMAHACQDFVGSKEDLLGELTFLAIQGDIVVVLHELIVHTGGERLGDGVRVCRGARCCRRCRCRSADRRSCHDAGLALHLDDLIEDDPRRGDGVRYFLTMPCMAFCAGMRLTVVLAEVDPVAHENGVSWT